MRYQLACGDVMPGCAATFDEADEDALLGQVAGHAAAEHGVTDITPAMLAAVQGNIRTTE